MAPCGVGVPFVLIYNFTLDVGRVLSIPFFVRLRGWVCKVAVWFVRIPAHLHLTCRFNDLCMKVFEFCLLVAVDDLLDMRDLLWMMLIEIEKKANAKMVVLWANQLPARQYAHPATSAIN